MKLTVVFLTAGFLQLSAHGLSQNITYSAKEASLEKVFAVIEQQTGYVLLYDYAILEKSRPVTISVKDMPLETFLTKVLSEQSLEYIIRKKAIFIVKKGGKTVSETTPAYTADTVLPVVISGIVRDQEGNALAGATVVNRSSGKMAVSGVSGQFTIPAEAGDILVISFVGFETREMIITGRVIAASGSPIAVSLQRDLLNLDTAVITVSTGFQQIPKERAVGSFVQVDNQLLNRSVSTGILERLDAVASGLIFNRFKAGNNPFSIRGQSTIFANANPLVVVDNFPYDGDIVNINPNDVESITILKDAAAASIWGARAGNGVLVITTKRGKYNKPFSVQVNTNVTIAGKPDLYYVPRVSSSDYINNELKLFDAGYYISQENSPDKVALTPVVEILIKKRDGLLSAAEADALIADLRTKDVRRDQEKYLYRDAIRQQHALNISGGADKMNYYLSAGYDNNLLHEAGNSYDRITLNAVTSFSPVKPLELTAGIYYVHSLARNNTPTDIYFAGGALYPYAQLADANGNPLPTERNYRKPWVEAQQQLPDWQYRALDELKLADNRSKAVTARFNLGIKYRFAGGLQAEIKYQYQEINNSNRNYYSPQTYFSRNLINSFSSVSGSTVTRPIPAGGILDQLVGELVSNNIRWQLNYNRTWQKHEVAAIAGYDVREVKGKSAVTRLYGYDDQYITSIPVDYTTFFPSYINPMSQSRIPYINANSETLDRAYAYFANATYSYSKKYFASVSGRKDASNLFGVNTNQKIVPLWSAGLGWRIDGEAFYPSVLQRLLPLLKMRVTYGFNGNVDNTLTAYTTAKYGTAILIPVQSAQIITPPNPDLRWEKVKIVNLALDFASANQRFTGSVEYYRKNGMDLIAQVPVTGMAGLGLTSFSQFRKNAANTEGHGLDVQLNIKVLDKKIRWDAVLLYSSIKEKVTHYEVKSSAQNYVDPDFTLPLVGKPLYGVYSFPWAGLDPATGDPQGWLNGNVSKQYATIVSTATLDDIVYNGPGRPTSFGSLRNDISWKSWSLSALISYRLGYYFRRTALDYAHRWQKPGDEEFTNEISFQSTLPLDVNRTIFYLRSETLVEKGDHIRLQDVRLSYTLSRNSWSKCPFQNVQVYIYGSNLGIIWKANKVNLDPDYPATVPPSLSVAMGMNIQL